MMQMAPVRKTITFPEGLAKKIEELSTNGERSFTAQVIFMLKLSLLNSNYDEWIVIWEERKNE